MGKLWATLKYGSARTKTFIILVFVLLAGGALLSVLGIMNYELWQLGAGAVCLIGGLVMVFMANFSTESVDEDDADMKQKKDNGSSSGSSRNETKRDRDSADSRKNKSSDKRTADEDGASGTIGRTAEAGREVFDRAPEEADFGVLDEDGNEVRETGDRNTGRVQQPVMVNVSKYDESEYRRTLRRYKVKRQFTSIIIDDCKSFNTSHTPTLVWVKKNVVNFLLLEGNERVCTMPLDSFLKVSYERDVPEENMDAYDAIRNEMGVFEKFADVMPQFTSSTNRLGRSTYAKNRYILGRDLAITPASLRALRDKFKFAINIFDALNITGEYSMYFKKAYEARILWTDNVIGQTEYQNRISNILQSMVDDKKLIRYDFLEDLERMVQYRLITSEYADYYNAQRQKRDAQQGRR